MSGLGSDMPRAIKAPPFKFTLTRVLTSDEIERRVKMFNEFSKNLVGFREGKQSSIRGGWNPKEYSEFRLMMRQVPQTKAFEMYSTQMQDIAVTLTAGIRAYRDAPREAAIIERYVHAWSTYSYVFPRAASVLREMQLKPGRTFNGISLYAERESDYRVQGVNLFVQALAPSEPHVLLAFGYLVCQCLSGSEFALERLPILKSVVSSYIQMHDCSCLFSEIVPQETLRSATSQMRIEPSHDETAIYTRSGGLEETMLQVSWL
jgi:hypothetical protein